MPLFGQSAESKQEIKLLKDSNADLSAKITAIEEKNGEVRDELTRLQEQIGEVAETAKIELTAIAESVSVLKEAADDLEAIEHLEQRCTTTERKLAELELGLATLRNEHAALFAVVKKMEPYFTSMKQKGRNAGGQFVRDNDGNDD